MSKKRGVLLIALFVLAAIFLVFAIGGAEKNTGRNAEASAREAVIWTYDSFTSEWGPGAEVRKRFLEQTGITITWVSHGDAGSVLSRLLMEEESADADIILGIDQNYAERALNSDLLEAYKPAGVDKIASELIIDGTFRLIPFDYSYFAIVYDSEKIPHPPQSLEDLTDPAYTKKIILMDPRTSSPGLGFLTWTKTVYGDGWKEYWKRLSPSILTITEGWNTGYGLFTSGEAPLALSYTTSPGYHLEYEETERYRAALFKDGHVLQVEVAGLLHNAKNKDNAKKFLDFMLSSSFQELIPLTNWMYPVIDIPLPASFRINPKSDKPLNHPARLTQPEINEWAALMSGR
jgi:thiamine transport system substrate-binding protein